MLKVYTIRSGSFASDGVNIYFSETEKYSLSDDIAGLESNTADGLNN